MLKRLSNVVVNPTDREDIIQNACEAILHANPALEKEEDIGKYFTRTLFSKVAAYKNAGDDVTVLSGFVHKEPCPDSNPIQGLMDAENLKLIPKLIDYNVPEGAVQDALHLVYCEGVTTRVAADIVGVKRSAVDTANSRFKKEVLGEYRGMR